MISIQGIAWDEKSSFLKGPALAPSVIREYLHSESSNNFSETGIDISNLKINDFGDYTIGEYFDIEKITAENLRSGNKMISLGGDHSISFPIIKAFNAFYGEFDILHIDAHGDLYDEFEGDPYSHACPFARIMEGKYAHSLTQVGIRTLSSHQRDQIQKFGVNCIEMKDYSLATLPKFNRPLYISIDVDAIDPAFAPGVSHHEPGGFSSRQVIDLLLSLDAEIIGADLVEYNPRRDVNGITGMLCAKLLKEILAKISQ